MLECIELGMDYEMYCNWCGEAEPVEQELYEMYCFFEFN